jgi:spore coat polysaccharide biosynthesis protein SpsF
LNTPKKIVTIIQARTGSTRLPNKVFMPLQGKSLLIRMIERVMLSQNKGNVVVATTTQVEDNVIQTLCERNAIPVFRGHPTDLLDRHYQAAKYFGADVVLKIPSDCPLIDPVIIDKVIARFLENGESLDYVSNLHPGSWPDGNDVEVFSFSALEYAWENALEQDEREHTTPYIYKNTDIFKTSNVEWETGLDFSESHRFTIDYHEDYAFIKRVYDELFPSNPSFGLDDILNLLNEKPDIKEINKMYAGQFWWKSSRGFEVISKL